MWYSKGLILLIGALFTLAAVNANSITIRQTANSRVAFEVEYQFNGRKQHEFSGYFSKGESKTIDIPDKAIYIHLNVCSNWEKRCKDQIFTKYYNSPVSKCFTLSEAYHYTEESLCQKLPAEGHSISVHQRGDFKAIFEVTYKYNGENSKKSSGEIVKGYNKTIQIPDQSTDISLTIYKLSITGRPDGSIVTKTYPLPVKKCFELEGDGFFSKDWFEKPCEKLPALNGNLISVRQTGSFKIELKIVYTYEGTKFTESSGTFSKGEKMTIQIPDRATDIIIRIHEIDSFGKKPVVFTESFSTPVKKCFKGEGSFGSFSKWPQENC